MKSIKTQNTGISMKKTLALLTLAIFTFAANATEVSQTAPQFTLPNLKTQAPTPLKQFAGKVVYLDFWASWCAPCKKSFPALNALHQKLKTQGFEVLAVNLDEDKALAEKFLQDVPVDFTVLRDAKGEWSDQYVVETMPTSFILDKNGVVQKIHHGFTSDDMKEIESKITELLAKK
jgi:thiol-disulfide isomerase/thioredoxin